MNGLRDEFFAGACFPRDQNRRIGWSDCVDLSQNFDGRPALADNSVNSACTQQVRLDVVAFSEYTRVGLIHILEAESVVQRASDQSCHLLQKVEIGLGCRLRILAHEKEHTDDSTIKDKR